MRGVEPPFSVSAVAHLPMTLRPDSTPSQRRRSFSVDLSAGLLAGSPRRSTAALFMLFAALMLGSGCDSGAEADSGGASEPAGRETGGGFADVDTVKHVPLEIPSDAPTILFLGDSITAGLHLPVDQAFPAAVQRQAFASGRAFHIVNAGVSGDTTRGGLNRLPLLLKNTQPDAVVVELGANDGLRGQSLKSIDENLREIVGLCREAGAKVLLLQMNVPTNLGEYAEDFAEIYVKICEDLDVFVTPSFLDGVGGIPGMNLPDGMHPTPEGHERLAKNITRTLVSMMSEARPFKQGAR